ncbi:MAG: Mur ligase family protein, partial [Pseudomonadota bacterium]
TEKLWVSGHYASASDFIQLSNWIRPIAESCRGPEVPLHGMASVAIALEYFRRSKIEMGVIEVGVGGRNDLTNIVQTSVAIVSAIGLDHVKTLGPTLQDIAWHKAGIIKTGCRAVTLEGAGLAQVQDQAKKVGAPLRILCNRHYHATQNKNGNIRFDFVGKRLQLKDIQLAMRGKFQAQNATLAIAAIEELDPEGERIKEDAVRSGLAIARLPARLELFPCSDHNSCRVLLDGAHNPPQLDEVQRFVSQIEFEKLFLIFGGLVSHAPDKTLELLARKASCLILTEPKVYAKQARPIQEFADQLKESNSIKIFLEPDAKQALALALKKAGPKDLIVVTGSLYLAGELRNSWYPEEKILLCQTSWS